MKYFEDMKTKVFYWLLYSIAFRTLLLLPLIYIPCCMIVY